MNANKKFLNISLALLFSFSIYSCNKNNGDNDNNVNGPDLMVYGITTNNELISFNSNKPGTFSTKMTINGIGAGEKLLSIDFRPSTGELYALSNASKIYVVNHKTAVARMIGSASFTPAIAGSFASIDFNPTVDRIRLVSNSGQNLRLHPETGAVAATDGAINGGTNPMIAGIAYTNSVAGASSTILYDIDASQGKLFKQDLPNDGKLVEVGSLGITFSGQAAFDISPDNSSALIAINNAEGNGLYLIDLATGKAKKIDKISTQLLDIAIPTWPVAYAVDTANKLHIFNPENPQPVSKDITGLATGERIKGIDFRPVNGQLYALGSSSRLYILNLGTGAATAVGTSSFTPMLTGTDFGFDFNPTVDRIRLVSNTGQNLRLHPETGVVAATDGIINPGMPSISAGAYTNNFAGTTSTSLFVIDHDTDMLYLQNPPNNGTLVPVGALGINLSANNGFDIGSVWGKAYLAATLSGSGGTKIYEVNTSTGAAKSISNLNVEVHAFAMGLGF